MPRARRPESPPSAGGCACLVTQPFISAPPQLPRHHLTQRRVPPLPPPPRDPPRLLRPERDLSSLGPFQIDRPQRTAHGLMFSMPIGPMRESLVAPNVSARTLIVLAVVVPPVLGVAERLLLLRRLSPHHCQRVSPGLVITLTVFEWQVRRSQLHRLRATPCPMIGILLGNAWLCWVKRMTPKVFRLQRGWVLGWGVAVWRPVRAAGRSRGGCAVRFCRVDACLRLMLTRGISRTCLLAAVKSPSSISLLMNCRPVPSISSTRDSCCCTSLNATKC